MWLAGLTSPSEGVERSLPSQASTFGAELSFQKIATLRGSIQGFNGSVTVDLRGTGTLEADGTFSGTFVATGSGDATGFGCKLTFSVIASGSFEGPFEAVTFRAYYFGWGHAVCDDGSEYDDSLSGEYTAVTSLFTGEGNDRLSSDNGNGAFSGDSNIRDVTTTSLSMLAFGTPTPPPQPQQPIPWDPNKDWCTLVPDEVPDGLNFKRGCWQHDNDYSDKTDKTRLQADVTLLMNLLAEANAQGQPDSIWPWVYFMGVRKLGKKYYEGPADWSR